MPAAWNLTGAEAAPSGGEHGDPYGFIDGMDLACAAAMTLPATRHRNDILAQHRDLLELAVRIEALVEDSGIGEAKAWRAALAGLLAEFIRKLENHFEAEVKTTSFDGLRHDAVLAAQLRELNEEHRTLRTAFEHAHRMALSDSTPVARVRDHTCRSICDFREHEAKEDALFAVIP